MPMPMPILVVVVSSEDSVKEAVPAHTAFAQNLYALQYNTVGVLGCKRFFNKNRDVDNPQK